MIIRISPINENPNIHFDIIYLCTTKQKFEILENIDINLYVSDDKGITADIDDPFLLSYIYSN